MKLSIISVFPELHETFLSHSIVAKAIEKKLLEVNCIRLSDLCPPKVRIDEPTCGPGVGMIIKPEIIEQAIDTAEKQWGKGFKIFFSPQGTVLNQNTLKLLAQKLSVNTSANQAPEQKNQVQEQHLILVCTRYEGTDTRAEEHYADLLLSIGDYVLMGGDIPAQVFLESFLRLVPGIIGKQQSVEEDSFNSPFLDHPHYGKPDSWKNKDIPEVLLSGNHAKIEEWRKEQAIKTTIKKRFDWFRSQQPSTKNIALAKKQIPNHYLVLMHSQVMIKDKGVGNTSIASLDIHDIARSCRTYGISNYFIVSALTDQQKIMNTFLEFWRSNEGKDYNKSRFDAVALVQAALHLDEVVKAITEKEGAEPVIVTTSAKNHTNAEIIDYQSQATVWHHNRPVLLVFGTGQGLADEVLDRSNYLLLPVEGMTNYNHLSVRSAVGIILDRWLGLQPQLPKL